MTSLCIECTHSSLRGAEPQTQLVCQRHGWIVVSTDTCTEYEALGSKRQGIRGILELSNRLPGSMMYGLPGSAIQFGAKRARSKPGRKSSLVKFLERQRDLFPADLFTSKLVAASRTARSDEGARTDRLPATAAPQQTVKKSTGFDLRFSDLRRCSTADQSGLPDFEDFSDGH